MKLLAYAAAALSLTVASAVADPITDRKDMMKERGGQMRVLAPIAQGQQPFDAAAVMAALQTLAANAERGADLDTYWPQGSDTGDTRSRAAIWEDRAGYQAASDKFKADMDAAVAANPQDLASFQAVFGPVGGSCGTCHEVYRN